MPSSIGAYDFDLMETPPALPHERVLVHARPGINGVQVQQVGAWADPWQFETVRYVDTFANAHALAKTYQELPLSNALIVVWQNVNYFTAYGVKFFVLEVRPLEVRVCGKTTGTIVTNPGAVVRAAWTLQGVV